MDMQLAIEVMFCVVGTTRSGRRVTAGEVAKRCGGVVTYHVAKKLLKYLREVGILDAHIYQHRPAAGARGAIMATHYTLSHQESAVLFYKGAAAHWSHLVGMYEIVKVGA